MPNTTKIRMLNPMQLAKLYLLFSSILIIIGFSSLLKNGLKLGIDFTGGTTIVWEHQDIIEDDLRQKFQEFGVAIEEIEVNSSSLRLKTAPLETEIYKQIKANFEKDHFIKEQTFETIGPALGKELVTKTMLGLGLAAISILTYVGLRFKNYKFGISAIVAMLHDLLIVLGAFSLLGTYLKVEVDTLFVTALLTILSFSVHDTIVVYDRIREISRKHAYLGFDAVVNRAVTETMSRSINNSMTIIFMLLTMYLMGGETTKWFIFALLIGTISGTYSSTFIAAPLILLWDRWEKQRK